MNKIFFTADTHFGHEPMLHFGDGRPFDSVEEMNETMIDKWNAKVDNSDRIYIIGDFIWNTVEPEPILKRLKGNKFLIIGNHDRIGKHNEKIYNKYIEWIKDYFVLKIKNGINTPSTKIVLSHYRHAVWDGCHYGSWHLFGHEHGNCGHKEVINYPNSLDVGVDTNNFYPYSWEDVVEKVKREGRYKEDYRTELKNRDAGVPNSKWKADFIK